MMNATLVRLAAAAVVSCSGLSLSQHYDVMWIGNSFSQTLPDDVKDVINSRTARTGVRQISTTAIFTLSGRRVSVAPGSSPRCRTTARFLRR
jgi:hypothetical protein